MGNQLNNLLDLSAIYKYNTYYTKFNLNMFTVYMHIRNHHIQILSTA